MTKNSDELSSDEMAFEEWAAKYFEIEGVMILEISPHLKVCWQAAILYERKLSEKLVEALGFYADRDNWDDDPFNPTIWNDGTIDMGKMAKQTLKEYKDSK